MTSCLYWEDKLVDEQSMDYMDGSTTFVHPLKTVAGSDAHVESGYFNLWNTGIAVIEDEQVITFDESEWMEKERSYNTS